MKKNSHIHILVDTAFLEKLQKESKSRGITLSELCRQKISNNLQLDRIENLIKEVLK